jgi:pimeloyl-ACP methyl ester carboxylesterase
MATFVLVHGGFHGGWCWRRVARLLRAAGHEVFTPTLTGLGDRSHLAHLPINLSTHISDLVNVLNWEDLNDVVLCGHSYGGMVIAGAAEHSPTRINSLVFLDASVPEDGDSIMSTMPFAKLFIAQAARFGGLMAPPASAEVLGVNEADRAWVDSKTTPHPLATLLETLHLGENYRSVARRILVYAARGDEAPLAALYESFRGRVGYEVYSISPSGHDMMIDQPEKLADLLRELVSPSAKR